MSDNPVQSWLEKNDQVLRLRLNRPKANIIDSVMIDALGTALASHANVPRLLAVVLDAQGPNFSFGASVEEHLPAQCGDMLSRFHGLIMQMIEFPVPIIAVVQGQCLGGGLEVACACNRIIAAPDARLGQPEISLAVFAPAASCLLPERIGQSQAEMLLLSGQSIDAETARQMRLVDEISAKPAAAALAWIDSNIIGKSATSLRLALTAVRYDYVARVRKKLASVEASYLDDLMKTNDALEGLNAFIERRKPVWENHKTGVENE